MDATLKYFLGIDYGWPSGLNWWDPNTEAIIIPVGEEVKLRMVLSYTGNPKTGEAFALDVRFYARDS